MAIYEFICHDCEVIWEREAAMSKAPSRSRCPECKKLSNRHWGEVPVMFNGSDYYTNKRKAHNLRYYDKQKGKEVMETLVDETKRSIEDGQKKSPYKNIVFSERYKQEMHSKGLAGARSKQELEEGRKHVEKLKESVYNNSAAYRNLGKR